MGDKEYTLVLKVDLSCCSCRKDIQKYLCKIKCQESIEKTEYDEKKNEVRISGPFNCPEQLKGKLLCKFRKEIQCIEIIPPKKPKDELKERFMKKCTDEYEEVKKNIEKCKAECEEKYMDVFKSKCKTKCKSKCKSKCNCSDCCDDEPPPCPPKPKSPKPCPPTRQPCPSDFVICCARPCVCFVVWANHYQCCTCGVVCWPKSGPGCGIRPQWGCEPNRPQWSCEPARPQWGCEPTPPQWGCQTPSHPRRGFDPCQPNVVIESSPPCSIM